MYSLVSLSMFIRLSPVMSLCFSRSLLPVFSQSQSVFRILPVILLYLCAACSVLLDFVQLWIVA